LALGSIVLTAVGEAKGQIVCKGVTLERQKNRKIDNKSEEISDIRMCSGDVTDMVSLHTLDSIIFGLINLSFFQVFLSRLSNVGHISRQSWEQRSIKDQCCTLLCVRIMVPGISTETHICNICDDIQDHRRRPLARIADSHHAILEDPADNSEEEQKPAAEAAIICSRSKAYEHDSHDREADAIGDKHDTRDRLRPRAPSHDTACITTVSWLLGRHCWIPSC
jgi:hypothetical protein